MYYESLIKFLDAFFKEQEIVANEDGTFSAKEKNIKIAYNEGSKCYELFTADKDSEFVKISSYLFDESQKESDVESVAIDFADSLRKNLGIKNKRSAEAIELPTDEGGETVSLSGLTQKLLAFFPAYKDTYKVHCSENNRFLPVDFYKEYLIPAAKNLLSSGNKKQIKKFYDAMREIYVNGDAETGSFTVAVIAAAVYQNEELKKEALAQNETECRTFSQNIDTFYSEIKASKKLRESLVK